MFAELYSFFYEWLFNSVQPSFLSAQGAEFVCIIFATLVLVWVVSLAVLPIKALVRWIVGG